MTLADAIKLQYKVMACIIKFVLQNVKERI